MVTRRNVVSNRIAIFTLCTVAGTTLALGTSQQAAAATAPSVTVSYRDLDLSRPADGRALYVRLVRAADAVCPAVPSYELERFAAYQRCVTTVLKSAMQRIHSVTLEQAANGDATSLASLRR
jgi:UrcA family protein